MKTTLILTSALLLACAARAAAPPTLDAARVRCLFTRLDDDSFAVRQRADRALRKLGSRVLPALRAELERTTSVEVRRRLRRMAYDLTLDERVPDLVRELGDQRNNAHARADWELRRYGKTVVPLLRKELSTRLSDEQRVEVKKLIADLSARRR